MKLKMRERKEKILKKQKVENEDIELPSDRLFVTQDQLADYYGFLVEHPGANSQTPFSKWV